MLTNNCKGRAATLSKAFLTAGLLSGAALSSLSAGSATAYTWQEVFYPTDPTTPFSTTVLDKTFTNFSTNIPLRPSPAVDSVEIGVNTEGTLWDVNANFDPNGPNQVGNGRDLAIDDFYEYTISVNNLAPAGTFLDTVFLAKITNPSTGPGSIQKEIFDGGTLLGTITADPASSFVVPGNYTSLRIRDTVTAAGNFDNISNNFNQRNTVPGPLPLLGAGAAFGFSRQIRKRIRRHNLA